MGIGSGGLCAGCRPRAGETDQDAETIVRRALDIAADICVYTNRNVTIEALGEVIPLSSPKREVPTWWWGNPHGRTTLHGTSTALRSIRPRVRKETRAQAC